MPGPEFFQFMLYLLFNLIRRILCRIYKIHEILHAFMLQLVLKTALSDTFLGSEFASKWFFYKTTILENIFCLSGLYRQERAATLPEKSIQCKRYFSITFWFFRLTALLR